MYNGYTNNSENAASNENFPSALYGQNTTQMAQSASPYYSADFNREHERRPLHPMQLDSPSLIGKLAQRQQQTVHSYHGRSQAPMCPSTQPWERQPSGGFGQGFGRGDSTDFPLSGQLPPSYPDHHLGHHMGQGHPVSHQSFGQSYYPSGSQHSQGPRNSGKVMRPFDGGLGYDPVTGMPLMGNGTSGSAYCDPPPAMYSAFTPSRTSTPTRSLTAQDNRGYLTQQSAERHEAPLSASKQGLQGCRNPQQGATGQSNALRARSMESVTFDHSQSALPIQGHRLQQHGSGYGPITKPISSASVERTQSGGSTSTPLSSVAASRGGARPPPPASTSSTPSFSIVSNPSVAAPASVSAERQGGRTTPSLERGLRVITGTVDNILSWGRTLSEEARPHVLFEIVGSLDSVVRGMWHSSRLVCLRSLGGNATLSAVFWEIDRPLFPPPVGSIVSCICRLGPKFLQQTQTQGQRRMPRMQVLKVSAVSPGQVAHLKRIAYISGHAVQQGALALQATPSPSPAPPPSPSPAPSPLKQTLISSYVVPERRS